MLIKNHVVKKAVYGKLAAKIYNIDTSDFVSKTKYDTDKSELEKKIPNVTDFVRKTKPTELENKIPDVSSLATKTEIEKLLKLKRNLLIMIMTSMTLAANVFNARLALANLITKADFDAKLSSLNKKVTSNQTKHLLIENELKLKDI